MENLYQDSMIFKEFLTMKKMVEELYNDDIERNELRKQTKNP